MSDFKEAKIKIVVKSSKCDHYKPGDVIYLDGPIVDMKKSAPVCLTAMSALMPFIYAARKRVTLEQMGFSSMTFQCPDIDEMVEFEIVQYDED